MAKFSKRERRTRRIFRRLGMQDFEKIADVQKRQISVSRRLHRNGVMSDLRHCTASKCRCGGLAACRFALYGLRRTVIPQATRILEGRGPLLLVSIVPPNYRLPAGWLATFSIGGFRQWLQRKLRSINAGRAIVAIGGIEFDLTEDDDGAHWYPHVHLVVAGVDPRLILVAFRGANDWVRYPIRVSRIRRTPARALGYCLKLQPKFRGLSGRRRLLASELNELSIYLATVTLDQRLVLIGMKRVHERLTVIGQSD